MTQRDPGTFAALCGTLAFVVGFLAAWPLTGCTSPSFVAAEADVNAALVRLEAAVDWVQANPDTIKSAVAAAVALDPENKTLLAVQAKTSAALDSGALPLAHLAVVGGIALTQPTTAPSPSVK